MNRRPGFSLLELIVATAALSVVIGPLIYAWISTDHATSSGHSAAMLSALVATERIKSDLDQLVVPDGPDLDEDGTRKSPMVIKDPGPDEGRTILFWIPAPHDPRDPMERRLKLLPVRYTTERIGRSDTFYLIRQVGSDRRPIPAVFVSQLWFKRLLFEVQSSASVDASSPLGAAANLPDDLMRVALTCAGQVADKEAMNRRDARRVPVYSTTFLQTIREPTLVGRMRDRSSGDRYKFFETTGSLE